MIDKKDSKPGLFLLLIACLMTVSVSAEIPDEDKILWASDDTFTTRWALADFCMYKGDNVLANDYSDWSLPLTAVLVTGPTRGTVNLMPDGDVSYCPGSAFVGPDSFQYRATDGVHDSNVASVTFFVTEAPVPGVCGPDEFSTSENTEVMGMLNSNDQCPGCPCETVLAKAPDHGSITYFDTNSFFIYSPNPGFSGTDSFEYIEQSRDDNWNIKLCTGQVTIHVGNPSPVPEFSSIIQPCLVLIGLFGTVFYIRRTREE